MRRWIQEAEKAIGNHSDRLNAINIFPVADGDTGTNIYRTLKGASDAISGAEWEHAPDAGSVLAEASRAAMEEARGNSGTLLSVFLAAMAEALRDEPRLSASLLARGLHRAQMRCWSALSDPVEGTMLSVLATAALAAADADDALNGDDSNQALISALGEVIAKARAAVVHTEDQLSSLTTAQVVDAGGVGLLLVLETLRATIAGTEVDESIFDELNGYDSSYPHIHSAGPYEDGYEVMCTIELSPLNAATLRQHLDEIGDSVIITPVAAVRGADDSSGLQEGELVYRWRVHVHVPDPTPALDLINALGDPVNVELSELTPEVLPDGSLRGGV